MAGSRVRLVCTLVCLAAATASGCRPADGRLRPSVQDPFAAEAPDIHSWSGKLWFTERTQALSAYAIELRHRLPLQVQPRRAVRFLILRGRVKARSAGQEMVLGRGAFLSIPRGTPYRILPLGDPAPRLLMLFMPDGHDAVDIEIPEIPQRLLTRTAP